MANLTAPELRNRSDYKKMFEWFRSNNDQESSGQRVWYSWFFNKDYKVDTGNKGQGVCSAGIYNLSEATRKRGVRVFPSIRPSALQRDRDLCERWFNWVTKESPFANTFNVKSFAYAFTYGFMIKPDEDVWRVHFALQALRQLQEHPEKIFVWKHLVDDFGVEPLQAFAVAEVAVGTIDNVLLHYPNSHGDMFDPGSSSLEAFLREPKLKGVSFAKGHYGGVGGMFPLKGDEKSIHHILNTKVFDKGNYKTVLAKIQESLEESSEKPVYVNPFMSAANKPISPKAVAIYLHQVFFGG